MTRSEAVRLLVDLVQIEPRTVFDALCQIGILATHWNSLRAHERERIQTASRHWAGLIQYRKARSTGTRVGVYSSVEAGLEVDPELKYSVVCEDHGSIVGVSTLVDARSCATEPDSWCDECREIGKATT